VPIQINPNSYPEAKFFITTRGYRKSQLQAPKVGDSAGISEQRNGFNSNSSCKRSHIGSNLKRLGSGVSRAEPTKGEIYQTTNVKDWQDAEMVITGEVEMVGDFVVAIGVLNSPGDGLSLWRDVRRSREAMKTEGGGENFFGK